MFSYNKCVGKRQDKGKGPRSSRGGTLWKSRQMGETDGKGRLFYQELLHIFFWCCLWTDKHLALSLTVKKLLTSW